MYWWSEKRYNNRCSANGQTLKSGNNVLTSVDKTSACGKWKSWCEIVSIFILYPEGLCGQTVQYSLGYCNTLLHSAV